jgi:hypothetical protein
VAFTPSASGSRTASVSIADNATAGSPQAVSLIGTGITGSVSLSATTLSFGSQSVFGERAGRRIEAPGVDSFGAMASVGTDVHEVVGGIEPRKD